MEELFVGGVHASGAKFNLQNQYKKKENKFNCIE